MDKIKYFGRGYGLRPFKIPGQMGYYFYISFESFERLQRINDAYRPLDREGRCLERIRVVGRGGIPGPHPFLLPKQSELYLYILKEDLERLEEINDAYRKALEAQRVEEERRRIEELEEQRRKEEEEERKRKEEEEEKRRVEAVASIENLEKTVEGMCKGGDERYPVGVGEKLKGLLEEAQEAFRSENYILALQNAQRGLVLAREIEKVKIRQPTMIYVYCLVPGSMDKVSFNVTGVYGLEVYTIPYEDMTAVVSNTSVEVYEPTEENMRRHHAMINRVMEEYEVLPMAFGMVFRDERRLMEMLTSLKGALKQAFKRVEGKVELGVKVICPKRGVELNEDAFASDVKMLRSLAASTKLGKRVSGRVLLNVHYLVAKENVERFSEEVKKLMDGYPQLKIHYTGPWPPYNFTTIRITK